mgnify:CR=1 FL=1
MAVWAEAWEAALAVVWEVVWEAVWEDEEVQVDRVDPVDPEEVNN